MDRNRVTVRYAKALIELAEEQNKIDFVDRDMRIIHTAFTSYQGFADYVLNPGDSSDEKFKKIKAIFAPQFDELSIRFLEMVFSNKREEYLKDLARNIIEMARKKRGILKAELVSAMPLDAKLIERIQQKFEKQLDKKLEMETGISEELIGGFIFSIDGQQYDASLASKIKSIQKQLQIK
ncbi:ATP synthase F1 subunit delta [Roseimarinus sediminis]|uniref:ATP synthase F1 subunit delta n=1 Tax=Roseimarinus sediminis TaxID=1610899 RepID=UPI003D236488